MSKSVYLALGSNRPGPWGTPEAALTRAVLELTAAGIRVKAASRILRTSAVGQADQQDYLNGVVLASTRLSPYHVLMRLKLIEKRAGRGRGSHWGPRPLDIDIIDYAGRRLAGPHRKTIGSLVLPHPEMHRRPFVVMPLAEIAPRWRHPRTLQSIWLLRRSLEREHAGRILKTHCSPNKE